MPAFQIKTALQNFYTANKPFLVAAEQARITQAKRLVLRKKKTGVALQQKIRQA